MMLLKLLLIATLSLYSASAGCTCKCPTNCNMDQVDIPDDFTGNDDLETGWCLVYCTTTGACDSSNIEGLEVDCEESCIGGDMRLFSCDENMFVPASKVKMGDKIRSQTVDKESTCSEVFYTFAHKGNSYHVLEFEIEHPMDPLHEDDIDVSKTVLSANHLVFVGTSLNDRVATLAKDVKVGDLLVTSTNGPQKVVGIHPSTSALVNVLTMDGTLELANGVIVSAYSYHEGLYAALFYPMKLMYQWFGGSAVESAYPYLIMAESTMKPFFAALASQM
eukprot:CAMPEP_0119013446 /NCGR_PEP_ID=MMETSP1176-20130426/8454_1 /TAXON_ID=265551 /ORGANISM="Synedropsis recta cf, Strain CCMP1620" /LENGTH=276 /DNA_ID=CAMNT_0006966537 /DNA_START=61 /DNA_END=891 /DNA_ORIENTATION=+